MEDYLQEKVSAIKKKQNKCTGCGKPVIGWKKCEKCRKKKYDATAKKKKLDKGISNKVDDLFYQHMWRTHDHYCAECDVELKEFKKWWMHHILPKSKYPHFRYDERNIIILCRQHHSEIESAISAPKLKVYAYCEEVKKRLLEEIGK